MSTKERKQREKELLKKTILEEAFRIVGREGHQALTIRKLAERIEYSPRTIYLYFEDKEDLLKAIVEFGFAATLRTLEANDYYRNLSAEEQLKTTIANHLRTAVENVNYYNTVIHIIQGAEFKPGPHQKKIENWVSGMLKPFPTTDGTEQNDSVFLLFASLRGITVELVNRRLPASEEELNQHIDAVFQFYKNLIRV